MIVFTTRSGAVLHGARSCPDLLRKPVFVIEEADALGRAVRCTHGLCASAFVRAEARAA